MIRYALAGPGDVQALLDLRTELLQHEAACDPAFSPGPLHAFRLFRDTLDMVDSPDRAQVLAWDGSSPAGYLAVRRGPMLGSSPAVATVEGWYIREGYRSRVGVGLVRAAWKLALVWGVDRVQFYVAAGNGMMHEIAAGRARPIAEVYELELGAWVQQPSPSSPV